MGIQADGKIVVVGPVFGYGGAHYVARLNANGTLDPTFGGDGKITSDFGAANAVAIQSNGRIVVGGHKLVGNDYDFTLVRYTANGALDSTFDGDGKVSTGLGAHEDINGLAIQTYDGKIVAAGHSSGDDPTQFALARYNSNGALDSTFDGDGKVRTGISGYDVFANAVAIQPNGKIVAAGRTVGAGSTDFELMRYNTNGALDERRSRRQLRLRPRPLHHDRGARQRFRKRRWQSHDPLGRRRRPRAGGRDPARRRQDRRDGQRHHRLVSDRPRALPRHGELSDDCHKPRPQTAAASRRRCSQAVGNRLPAAELSPQHVGAPRRALGASEQHR